MYICNIYWAHIEFLRGKGKCRHFYWLFCVCAPRTISNYLNPNTYWFWIIFRPTTPFLCFCEIYKKKILESPPPHTREPMKMTTFAFSSSRIFTLWRNLLTASRCFTWRTSIQNTSLHVLLHRCFPGSTSITLSNFFLAKLTDKPWHKFWGSICYRKQ